MPFKINNMAGVSKKKTDIINTYITKKNKLLVVICASLIMAIFVITWARADQSEYRPLIQDVRLVDAVRIADVLDKNDIDYISDVKSHMLYVNQEHSTKARIELAKIGIVIEYPKVLKNDDLYEAYALLSQKLEEEKTQGPIHEQPWFLRILRLMVGGVIIVVLILAIVRPALAVLINENEK